MWAPVSGTYRPCQRRHLTCINPALKTESRGVICRYVRCPGLANEWITYLHASLPQPFHYDCRRCKRIVFHFTHRANSCRMTDATNCCSSAASLLHLCGFGLDGIRSIRQWSLALIFLLTLSLSKIALPWGPIALRAEYKFCMAKFQQYNEAEFRPKNNTRASRLLYLLTCWRLKL